jgi:hypothetical protein
MEVNEDQKLKLISVDMNGKDRRTHAQGELVTEYQVSPTGDHIAFRENTTSSSRPSSQGAKTLDLGAKAGALPVTKATGIGGQYLHWSGNTLAWSLGPQLYTAASNALIRADGGKYAAPASGIPIGVTARADVPTGVTALVGAKVVTMADESGGIIEDGVVLIEGNRIRQVGRRGQVNIPAGARQVDVAGKFIIPGLIDAHAHGSQGEDDLVPQQNWEQLAHLAFGVTTVHDPSSTSSEIFPAGEMQRAGVILSPRIFSTGEIVYGARSAGRYAQIDSLDDALAHVRRLKAQGAHSIKNYNQPRRDQRQQVVAAALKENIAVVAEGGSLFEMDMALIADGNTTLEHNIPQARLYKDVLDFYGGTKVGYTPTVGVTYGGLAGEPYWIAHTEVWKHPLLTRYVPADCAQPELVRVTRRRGGLCRPGERRLASCSRSAACRSRSARTASSRASPPIGRCGPSSAAAGAPRGAEGGRRSLRRARSASATSARSSRASSPTSSSSTPIPLADIRNTDDVSKVMLNGRLYDAATLNEEVTGTRRRQPYYWEKTNAASPAPSARP